MMNHENREEPRKFVPQPHIDAALQRELDEALGDMSVEDLMAAEAAPQPAATAPAKGVKRGQVIAIRGDDVFVDMGGKSEGVVSSQQFQDEPLPRIGDIIEVTIEGYNASEGLLKLSRQGALVEASWETLVEGQIVEGRVTGLNKGGLELMVNGIRAFMPASQVEMFRVEDLSDYLNQKLRCQVSEVDQSERRVIVSRRALVEVEAAQKREEMYSKLVEGQTVSGVVKTIMPYGAFVDIGGVDGLLHVREMSHGRVEDPHSIVKEGQQVEVMIKSIDREARKIGLSMKQIMADPWAGADQKWAADAIVSGRVTRLADFGAFVELEPGVEGLIPMGEMTFGRRIKNASEILKAGDVVKVRVMSIDLERKRISLSLKRAGEDPWMGAEARWPENSVAEGIVARLADFGAFVELASGVEGLVHISELSDQHVRSVGEAVKEGDRVKVKVLAVDEAARRISLSIKQAQTADWSAAAASQPAEPKPEKKRKRPLKGGLD